MPDLTNRFEFEKATVNENYDVAVHARNMDKLDEILDSIETLKATTSGNNAYALTIPGITSYADMVGKLLLVKVAAGSTADVSFNVNGLGAKVCYSLLGGRVTSGDLLANYYYLFVCFDAVSGFTMLSVSAKTVGLNQAQTLTNKTINGSNNTITNLSASETKIADAGGLFTSTDVEGALQEVKSEVVSHEADMAAKIIYIDSEYPTETFANQIFYKKI